MYVWKQMFKYALICIKHKEVILQISFSIDVPCNVLLFYNYHSYNNKNQARKKQKDYIIEESDDLAKHTV